MATTGPLGKAPHWMPRGHQLLACPHQGREAGTVLPLLQMKKANLREVKQLTQRHTAKRRPQREAGSGGLLLEATVCKLQDVAKPPGRSQLWILGLPDQEAADAGWGLRTCRWASTQVIPE